MPYEGSEIADTEHGLGAIMPTAQESDDRVIGIVCRDPFEAVMLEVDFVQCRGAPIQMVEIANQPADAVVHGKIEQIPVEGAGIVPFIPLCELAPHEQQLLSGVCPHESI